jgi:hypothetical protein
MFFSPTAIEDPELFWTGFRAGVASWLVDQGIAVDTARPNSSGTIRPLVGHGIVAAARKPSRGARI